MVSRLHSNLMDRNRPLWECYVIGCRAAALPFTPDYHALIDG